MTKIKQQKWIFIVNPIAGNGYGESIIPELKAKIASYKIPGEIILTEYPGHASELAGKYVKPTTFLFAFVGDRIVGRVTIRLMLNEHLERNGGHIGYVIAPEFRRRGYATRMLASSLRIAREQFRLSRVLLTVDDDNLGSIKAIEKNGGVFDRMVDQAGEARPKRRYWIETGRNI